MTVTGEYKYPELLDSSNRPYFMDLFNGEIEKLDFEDRTKQGDGSTKDEDELVTLYRELIYRAPGFEDVPLDSVEQFAKRLAYGSHGFYDAGIQSGIDVQSSYLAAAGQPGPEVQQAPSDWTDDSARWTPPRQTEQEPEDVRVPEGVLFM